MPSRKSRAAWRPSSLLAGLLLAGLALSGCSTASGEEEAASAEPPVVGECRLLVPDDIEQPSNSTEPVACTEKHTAETFLVETFPAALGDDLDDEALGAHVYDVCQPRFVEFLGGDESVTMRSILTWAWFRPSKAAWAAGARWFRCDVVGGGEQSASFVSLPETALGALQGRPDDRWMVCVDGPTVAGSVKIACDQEHTWRAVTTIVLGKPDDPYPGDRAVEVRTRDFCSDSVGAWLNYPVDYEFGYTFFHRAEWAAGNRRSICWAKIER